jgi:hypothetical protein
MHLHFFGQFKKPQRLIIVLLLAAAPVPAQQGRGTIQGTVIDLETKEPLQGVNVFLQTVDGTPTTRGSASDRIGRFQIQNIEPGTYECLVVCIGYRSQKISPVTVLADSALVCDIELDSYLGYTAENARADLDSGQVRIFLVGWPIYSVEQAELARRYGFEVGATGCFPVRTDRYNKVVIDFLKKKNGEDWYEEFLKQWDELSEQFHRNLE